MTERTIFLAALEISDPVERTTYLDQACAGDAALRRQVEGLFAAHERQGAFLDVPAVEQIAGNRAAAGNSEETRGEPPGDGVPVLDFLSPSQQPGSLGRLGHYEMLELLGQGGMGVVLRAFDEKLRRVVAVKVLAPQLATNGSARQRFVREARAAAAVIHDNVIGIHAVEDQGPVPYLVMQFVEGRTLQQKLDGTGPLTVVEILRIGLQTAEGLAAAHRRGLIHRDVKPSNILLENGVERVKLTDFGLARAADDASLTQSGVIAGTPMYMSPEQAEAKAVDHRSDLFSFGSVLYAMCTGRSPFRGSGTMAVLKRVCEDTPRPIRESNPEIPNWLCAIVAKLQDKDPAQRFQSAAGVAERLGNHLAHLQQPGLVSRPATVSFTGQVRSRRALVVAAAMLLFTVAALAVSLILRRGESGADDPGVPNQVEGPQAAAFVPRRPLTRDELAKLPSPLDARKREDLPPALLALAGGGDPALAPSELVAVLSQGHVGPVLVVAVSPDGTTLASAGNDQAVRLWDLGTGKVVHTLAGHTQPIWSLAFSPDGRLLASGSLDATVMLWDAATGKEVHTLSGHTISGSSTRFSADGRTLAAGTDDGAVQMWDVATGNRLEPLRWHMGRVRAVAFSPDGRWLASGGDDGSVQLRELAHGRLLHTFPSPGPVIAAEFTPDGRMLASVSGNPQVVRLWDLESKKELAASAPLANLEGLAMSPGGNLLASGQSDGTVAFWDLASGLAREQNIRLLPPGQPIHRAAFTPEGRYLATANDNGAISILRVPAPPPAYTPAPPAKLPDPAELANRPSPADALERTNIPEDLLRTAGGGDVAKAPPELVAILGDDRLRHDGEVVAIRFIDDDKTLVSVSRDKTVRFWDAATGRQKARVAIAAPVPIMGAALSPDGQLVATGYDHYGVAQLWETTTGKELHTLLQAADRGVLRAGLVFSPDGKTLVSGGRFYRSKLWDVAAGKELHTLRAPGCNIHSYAFSPDGKTLAVGDEDHWITTWNVETGKQINKWAGRSAVIAAAFAPDGKTLATGDCADATVQIWDAATGEARAEFRGHALQVNSIMFSPDGKFLASGGEDKTAIVWDVATGKKKLTLLGHGARVYAVAFSADGKTLATASGDGSIKLWDTADGREHFPRQGHLGQVMSVAISPDGATLASSGSDQTIRIWDLASARLRHTLSANVDPVAFSPDSKILASGGRNGSIKLWDAATGQGRQTLTGHGDHINGLAFSPDATSLASASYDGTVKRWDLVSGKCLDTFTGHRAGFNSQFTGHQNGVFSLSFSPDGRLLASGGQDMTVRLWDVTTGWGFGALRGHVHLAYGVAVAPDGHTLASCGYDKTIRLWDLATLQSKQIIKASRGDIVAWRADGLLLAAMGNEDGIVQLWDINATPPRCRTLQLFPPGTRYLTRLAFSPEGRYLATANPNGTVYVLRLAGPGEVFRVHAPLEK